MSKYSIGRKPPDSASRRDYKRGFQQASLRRSQYTTEEINAFLKDKRFNLCATDPFNCGYRDGLSGKTSKYA